MNEPPGDVECYCDGEENHTGDSQQIKGQQKKCLSICGRHMEE